MHGTGKGRDLVCDPELGVTRRDILRVGGVTPWMKVAGMAEAFNLPVVSHLLPEIHVHLVAAAPNALVVEYDPAKKTFRTICEIKKTLQLKEGMYVPGKIHTTLTMGSDGWLYFGTHRGAVNITSTAQGYNGDWILRCHPESGKSEIGKQPYAL